MQGNARPLLALVGTAAPALGSPVPLLVVLRFARLRLVFVRLSLLRDSLSLRLVGSRLARAEALPAVRMTRTLALLLVPLRRASNVRPLRRGRHTSSHCSTAASAATVTASAPASVAMRLGRAAGAATGSAPPRRVRRLRHGSFRLNRGCGRLRDRASLPPRARDVCRGSVAIGDGASATPTCGSGWPARIGAIGQRRNRIGCSRRRLYADRGHQLAALGPEAQRLQHIPELAGRAAQDRHHVGDRSEAAVAGRPLGRRTRGWLDRPARRAMRGSGPPAAPACRPGQRAGRTRESRPRRRRSPAWRGWRQPR